MFAAFAFGLCIDDASIGALVALIVHATRLWQVIAAALAAALRDPHGSRFAAAGAASGWQGDAGDRPRREARRCLTP